MKEITLIETQTQEKNLSTITIPNNVHFIRHFLNTKCRRSNYTSTAYETDIKEFFSVNNIEDISINDIRRITIFDVENYINNLVDIGRASTTIHRKISSLSSLYKWLMRYQDNTMDVAIIKYNPFANMKDVKPTLSYEETEFLTRDEAAEMLKNIKTDTIVGLRNKAIISLALNTAIRKSEIINIKLKDITTILGFDVIRVTRKRNKKDVVKINSYVKNLVLKYIRESGRDFERDKEDYLFKGHSTNRYQCKDKLNPATINKIMANYYSKNYMKKKLKVHGLRHSAITIAIQKGATLDKVQAFAGHESANTTARYIHSVNKLQDNAGDLIDVFE